MDKTVYIVGGDWGQDFQMMFEERGWQVVRRFEDAAFIQFTGGEDVDPSLYGEQNTHSGFNRNRDAEEGWFFNRAREAGKNMLGVCRGGQFLTVMSGHEMWQDVDNHGLWGTHEAIHLDSGDAYQVTSTHHQMMRPTDKGSPYKILVAAGLSEVKQGGGRYEEQDLANPTRDVEAVFYPENKALAFQPHPEYVDSSQDCNKLYFRLIEECFGGKG